MKRCSCGQELQDEAEFCTKCGARLDKARSRSPIPVAVIISLVFGCCIALGFIASKALSASPGDVGASLEMPSSDLNIDGARALDEVDIAQVSYDFVKAWRGDWLYEEGKLAKAEDSVYERCLPYIDPTSNLDMEGLDPASLEGAEHSTEPLDSAGYYDSFFMGAYTEQLDSSTCLVAITASKLQGDLAVEGSYARMLQAHSTEWYVFSFNENGLLIDVVPIEAPAGYDIWCFAPTADYHNDDVFLETAEVSQDSGMVLSGSMRVAGARKDVIDGTVVGPDEWRLRLAENPAFVGIGASVAGIPEAFSVDAFNDAIQSTGLPLTIHVVGDQVVYAALSS